MLHPNGWRFFYLSRLPRLLSSLRWRQFFPVLACHEYWWQTMTQFTSDEFRRFVLLCGIFHYMEALYHPQTNGLAERVVQSVKNALHKMKGQSATFNDKLQWFLTAYRNTPHKTTGKIPAELLLGQRNYGRLDLIRPTTKPKRKKIVAKFRAGVVMARNLRPEKKNK